MGEARLAIWRRAGFVFLQLGVVAVPNDPVLTGITPYRVMDRKPGNSATEGGRIMNDGKGTGGSPETSWLVRYAQWVIRMRWPVVIGTLLLVAVAGAGAGGLYFDADYRAFFGEENPQLQAFEELQNIYTKNDNVLFVVAPDDGEVFGATGLEAVEELTTEAWQIPYAIRVDAVTNFQHSYAEEDDLIVGDLVEGGASLPSAERDRLRDIALGEPLIRDRLLNDDASVTGVNVTLRFPGEEATEVGEAAGAARLLGERIETQHPSISVYLTGGAMLDNAFQEVSQQEMATLLPIMLIAMFFVMIAALRSFSATAATLGIMTLSVVVGMGLAGYFRVGLTPPSGQAPVIIMTLAIADSIHVLVTMLKAMSAGMDKRSAIVESIRVNAAPVFLTSLSTVIGFLSFNFSDVPPFHHLGNITAAGVTAAFGLSMFFLPALMAILPVRARDGEGARSERMDRLGDWVVGRRRPLLWGTSAVLLFVAGFVPANELDDRFVEYFDDRIDFRNDTDFTSENLTGIYQLDFSLSGGETGSISEPDYLETVDAFSEWLRAQDGVIHVNSITDVMKRLNKNLHGDDLAYDRLPGDRELAAQYLLLYEMSLPYGLDLNNQINVDKSATRLTATLDNISSAEILSLAESAERWLRDNAPTSMHSVATGPMVMFANISGNNIKSMLIGSALALVLISVLMIVALRSTKLGMLSFVPNLLPGAVAFGIWGLTVGTVNIGLSMVIGMTLGIVVDDSVHFLTKYLRARRELGLSSEDAVRYAFKTVGTALVATTATLIIGFGILATSAFDANASMGRMTVITLGLALLVDFLLLPPLLMVFDRVREPRVAPKASPGLVPARN